MSEQEKAVAYLTDLGNYDEEHQAWLYNKASLHGVDSFFNQVRRLLSLLERPIHSKSNNGRIWNGYSPYNPGNVAKVLEHHAHGAQLHPDRQEWQDASRATRAGPGTAGLRRHYLFFINRLSERLGSTASTDLSGGRQ